jgi:hypothetical protein
MRSFFRKKAHRAAKRLCRAVRPMLECLEDRNLLSASDVTFNFNVPAGVGDPGDTINFYIFGTLDPSGTGYTPSYGPDAGTPLAKGTVVYLVDAGGHYDWAATTSTLGDVPSFASVPAGTPDTLSVSLPTYTPTNDAYVTSGEIVMGVSTPGQPFSVPVNSDSIHSIAVPNTQTNGVYALAEFGYNAAGLDTDGSEVDQIGMPFTINTSQNGSQGLTMGVTAAFSTLLSQFATYTQTTPGASDFSVLKDGDLRITSPGDYLAENQGSTQKPVTTLEQYFNPALTAFFNHYTASSFSLDYPPDSGTFSGNTTTLTLAPWYTITNAQPSGSNAQITVAPYDTSFDSNAFAQGDTVAIWGVGTGYDGNVTILSSQVNANNTITFTYAPPPGTTLSTSPTYTNSYAQDLTYHPATGDTYTVLQLTFTPNGGGSSISGFDIYDPTSWSQQAPGQPTPPPGQQAPGWLAVANRAAESPGEMIFGCDGVFNSGSLDPLAPNQGYLSDAENAIVSAFNRGIATNFSIAPSNWSTSKQDFYPQGGIENYYAAFLHQPSISSNGYVYAYAYDDQGGQSSNIQVPTPATSSIDLIPWGSSSSPSPSPSQSPSPSSSNGSLPMNVALSFLMEDRFASTVDSIVSMVTKDPALTSLGDRLMDLYNDVLLHLDNPALGTGLDGLLSAINSNPYSGTLEGLVAQMIGLEMAVNQFAPQNPS